MLLIKLWSLCASHHSVPNFFLCSILLLLFFQGMINVARLDSVLGMQPPKRHPSSFPVPRLAHKNKRLSQHLSFYGTRTEVKGLIREEDNTYASNLIAASMASTVLFCCAHNCAYLPALVNRTSWGPCSTTFPFSRTIIWKTCLDGRKNVKCNIVGTRTNRRKIHAVVKRWK